MNGKKIYPKVKAKKGLAFIFKDGNKSYMIKLAGNPMILIEQIYLDMGGEEFKETYELAKQGKLDEGERKEILKTAVDTARMICMFFKHIGDRNKTPFVVYSNDV